MDPFYYFCFMFVFVILLCLFLAALWSPAGKAPFCSLVCDVFLCFCHFPIWCPESGVVLDSINS